MKPIISYGLCALVLLILVLWIADNAAYDADLERQHIMETGHTWADMEEGRY